MGHRKIDDGSPESRHHVYIDTQLDPQNRRLVNSICQRPIETGRVHGSHDTCVCESVILIQAESDRAAGSTHGGSCVGCQARSHRSSILLTPSIHSDDLEDETVSRERVVILHSPTNGRYGTSIHHSTTYVRPPITSARSSTPFSSSRPPPPPHPRTRPHHRHLPQPSSSRPSPLTHLHH